MVDQVLMSLPYMEAMERCIGNVIIIIVVFAVVITIVITIAISVGALAPDRSEA